MSNRQLNKKFAQAICNVMHPMFMATYAMIIICYFTPVRVIPSNIRHFLVGEVFVYTCAVPFATALALYKTKLVSHWTLRDRKDRIIPLFVNLLAFVICSVSLYTQGFLPLLSLTAFYGSSFIALVCLIISYWWKISGHALALSGVTTMTWIYLFMFNGLCMPITLPLTLLFMLGLVCSLRVYLGRHTLAQVYAGSAVGISVMLLSFWVMDMIFVL